MTREVALQYARRIRNKTKGASIIVLDGECIDAILRNPWHKVSEELPKMAHFTADGNFSDLCVCINESGEHKILVLCESGDDTYWAYGYDGEGLYDEEMDGGEIVKWMSIPEIKED